MCASSTSSGVLERTLAGEQQVFARPLRSLVRRAPVTCSPDVAVREAIAILHREGVGSVIVVDTDARPVGIFTTQDAVAATAGGHDGARLADAMTAAPFSLPGHAMAYEAALAMVSMRIRHVLVMEEEHLAGVVSERDLFSLQRLGLGSITTEIRAATSVDTLAELAGEIRRLARLLVDEGVASERLTHFVSVLNDRLCQRVLEVERRNHRLDALSWCWLAFGSEGRLEQTFSTDQDNGIAFESHDGASPDAVRARLLPFAKAVNEGLDRCGFPLCKGLVMASNPRMCLSVAEWTERIRGWIDTPNPNDLLDAAIFFDLRPLYGDASLATQLRGSILALTRASPAFLRLMAENALESRPPLGWLRDFATEDSPELAHSLNLKLHGARPFIDAARIYALAHGLPATNTAERLRAARQSIGMPAAETEALVQAFFAVQALRLRNQAPLAPRQEGGNRIDPDRLNLFERQVLKAAFRQAQALQARLALDYQV